MKGIPDISNIKEDLLYRTSLLTLMPLCLTTDFMLLSSSCNLVLARCISLLSSRSWLIFCFCFSNSSDIKVLAIFFWSTVWFILLNATWFEYLTLLISSLVWLVSVLILVSILLSFSLFLFSFLSNISLVLSSNYSIRFLIFVSSIFLLFWRVRLLQT